jgi:cell envelope-related transcriptional attenuator
MGDNNEFNFSEMQRGRRALKKKKMIRRTVNIVASIVLAISLLTTSVMGVYIFGLSGIKIGGGDESDEYEELYKSNHSGVSYILIAGLCPPEEGGMLTDTLIVACIDHNNKTLNFLQIPRDLYIGDEDGSSYSGGKVNAVYGSPREGETNINALRRVINRYLGIPLDHYVLFNIPAFMNLIDSLGGLTINIEQENGIDIMDYNSKKHHRIGPGWVTLDGSMAVGFIRKRTGDDYVMGDADRVQAQQLAYVALAKKLRSMTVSQMMSVATSCYNDISTDITLNDIIGYAMEVKGISMENMGVYAVPGQYSSYHGSSVWCVHKDEYIELYNEHFNPYGAELDDSILIYEWYREMGQSYEPSYITGGTLAEIEGEKNQ